MFTFLAFRWHTCLLAFLFLVNSYQEKRGGGFEKEETLLCFFLCFYSNFKLLIAFGNNRKRYEKSLWVFFFFVSDNVFIVVVCHLKIEFGCWEIKFETVLCGSVQKDTFFSILLLMYRWFFFRFLYSFFEVSLLFFYFFVKHFKEFPLIVSVASKDHSQLTFTCFSSQAIGRNTSKCVVAPQSTSVSFVCEMTKISFNN